MNAWKSWSRPAAWRSACRLAPSNLATFASTVHMRHMPATLELPHGHAGPFPSLSQACERMASSHASTGRGVLLMRTTCAVAPTRNTRNTTPIAAFRPGSSGPVAQGAPTGNRVECALRGRGRLSIEEVATELSRWLQKGGQTLVIRAKS